MSAYIWLFAGLLVMVVCGDRLVAGSVQLARHFRISTLVVGATIVAYVTATPEIFISVKAALDGSPDIALGNVIGSNIANIGCILAAVAIIYPLAVRNRAIGLNVLIMFVATFLLFVFGCNGVIGRLEGICFLFLLITFTVWTIVRSRKNADAKETVKATMKPSLAVLLILAAIVGLYFGSEWFVRGACELALLWGVSERVIAVSIVAVGTSMPELVTSLIAAFKREADLSIGNIVGSNFFNIAGVLGLTTTVHAVNISGHTLFLTDMAWLFGISVLLLLTMAPLSRGKIMRWEGAVLLAVFVVYMITLYK